MIRNCDVPDAPYIQRAELYGDPWGRDCDYDDDYDYEEDEEE
jgi:hypothetical protein